MADEVRFLPTDPDDRRELRNFCLGGASVGVLVGATLVPVWDGGGIPARLVAIIVSAIGFSLAAWNTWQLFIRDDD